MSTVIITGVDGFVGTHLAAAAKGAGHQVVGITQGRTLAAGLRQFLDEHLVADLREEWPDGGPADVIVHLAGLAAVGPSFQRPQEYISANSAMVTTLCEYSLRLPRNARPRIVGVSSGAVYAVPPEGTTLNESSPLDYPSPYVVSKTLLESQLAYYRGRGLDTLVARPFNHIGPGQSPGFLVPDLYHALRAAADSPPLYVGNLATERDYTDVRDVVQAYLLLATAPDHEFDVYNIASGTATSGWQILGLLQRALCVPMPPTVTDTQRFRAHDPKVIVGDPGRLRSEFGWSPRRRIEDSIEDFVRRSTPSVTPAHDAEAGQ